MILTRSSIRLTRNLNRSCEKYLEYISNSRFEIFSNKDQNNDLVYYKEF